MGNCGVWSREERTGSSKIRARIPLRGVQELQIHICLKVKFWWLDCGFCCCSGLFHFVCFQHYCEAALQSWLPSPGNIYILESSAWHIVGVWEMITELNFKFIAKRTITLSPLPVSEEEQCWRRGWPNSHKQKHWQGNLWATWPHLQTPKQLVCGSRSGSGSWQDAGLVLRMSEPEQNRWV